jgi:hypothetical protein
MKMSKKMEKNQNTTIELDDIQQLTNKPEHEVNKSLVIKQGSDFNLLLPT